MRNASGSPLKYVLEPLFTTQTPYSDPILAAFPPRLCRPDEAQQPCTVPRRPLKRNPGENEPGVLIFTGNRSSAL
ncbi:hypothetical protein Poly59_49230 [Rubripirellula reticaptiva]|uniref:Uncharacterized protein n=1 Tax=Rubripirellula reticaptiva TaxID=2528013 RepID=A0A5C6EGZ1_9BACT|nr:hypothetical protein Poly59_49230 [Rubripirellula reticaptiva]